MTQKEKSRKVLQAEERLRQAQAQLKRALQEEKAKQRKEINHQKFIMGGIVVKYFPDAYDFSELEMNRIIACAFKSKDVHNMINLVLKERQEPADKSDTKDVPEDMEEFDERDEIDYEEDEEPENGDL